MVLFSLMSIYTPDRSLDIRRMVSRKQATLFGRLAISIIGAKVDIFNQVIIMNL